VSHARCPRCGFTLPDVKDDPRRPCQCGTIPSDLAPYPWPDLAAAEWEQITHLLMVRCGGRCESCGLPFTPGVREVNRQHRRPRRMGGTDLADTHSLANLLLLCAGFSSRLGGVLGCHGRAEAEPVWAAERGLVLSAGTDPARESVLRPSGVRVLLSPTAPFYLPVPADVHPA
jgi:hypothetical protein